MNYEQMFKDSFEYVKDTLWGKWIRWLLLLVCVIIFPLFFGYLMEIMRGKKPAPELENWGRLFVDGLKLLVVLIVYAIPLIFILGISAGVTLVNPSALFTGMTLAIFSAFIIWFLISIIASIAIVRFSRLGSFKEAFNLNAIFEHIRRIGLWNYIIGLLLVCVALGVISFIIGQIPLVGGLLNFVLNPAYGIFFARFITLLYDSGKPITGM